jgi:hypothetical protein
MVNLAALGAEGPLADGREVYRTDEPRDALLDFDWLPRRHGALVTLVPVHAPNELYDTRPRILILEGPFSGGVTRRYRRLRNDPRFTDLRENLLYFRSVYAEILTERDEIIAGGLLPFRSIRYLRFTKRYFEYVAAQLAEVERMIERLESERANPMQVPRGRDETASAEGARSEAASASEPAKVGEADRTKPSEAVVRASLRLLARPHN